MDIFPLSRVLYDILILIFLIIATRKTKELTRFGFGEKFVVRIKSSLELNNEARQFISVSRTIEQAAPKKVKHRRNTVVESVHTDQNVERSNASNSSEKVANRRKSIAFNPTVKVYDLMNISKENIPFARSRPRLKSLNGEGCSNWLNQSNNKNHDSQDLVNTSHTPNGAEILPANNVVNDKSPIEDSPTELNTVELIDEVDSDVLQLARGEENDGYLADLPNIDTHEVRSIPESVNLIAIELIDLQSSIQSITTETVEDLNLIEFNASSENGNDELSGQMVHYSAENAPSESGRTTQKLIDVDSFDENFDANQSAQRRPMADNFMDILLGFNNDEPDALICNAQLIQPMNPNVGESRELVRRPVPNLLPIKKRRMSVGMMISSMCDDYDAQYLLPNNDENKEKYLMEIDFNAEAEYSFGKLH